MNREVLHLLLEKYLKNQSSAEEKLFVEKLYGMLDDEDLNEHHPNELINLEQKLWNNINQQADLKLTYPDQENKLSNQHKQQNPSNELFWYAAAVISTLALLTGYLFFSDFRNPQYIAFQSAANLVEKINTSQSLLTIKLEDGSTVVLQPKASLIYPSHFQKNMREVSLKGEAYFLISKNHKRPFFVYNNNVITRVVGTSFIIKANQNAGQTEVIVKTGKVVVSTNEDKRLNLKYLFRENSKVTLTPNQKTIYSLNKERFETSLVPEPIPVVSDGNQNSVKKSFLFEDTPLQEVLKELQDTYGIEIITVDQKLNRNTFTGNISKQSLYKKLDLICHSIKAYYEVSGTRILIKEKKDHQQHKP